MILLSALVFAAIFASGTFLLLQRDVLRLVVGIILVSNSAVFFIISAGLTRGAAPIHPLGGPVSDPLVQAMALTALVIGFGVAALLLAMVYRLFASHGTIDAEEVAAVEMRERNTHTNSSKCRTQHFIPVSNEKQQVRMMLV